MDTANSFSDLFTGPNRELPHDANAERCLLGALLVKPNAIVSTARLIGPEHFHDYRHQLICRMFEEMATAKEPADLSTVTAKLRECKRLDDAGGPGDVAEVPEIRIIV